MEAPSILARLLSREFAGVGNFVAVRALSFNKILAYNSFHSKHLETAEFNRFQ